MNELLHKRRHLTSSQIILSGFFLVIMVGSLLLMLPFATSDGKGASFADALFTATSAVCVTGLVVENTATYWSFAGQLILLLLIQIGGMGVVTVAVSIAVISGKKIGLMQRSTMQEAIAAPSMGGVVRITGFILRTSLCIELLGTVLLYPVFAGDYGMGTGLWYALFHAVSAFCNAGFDLLGGRVAFASLTEYADSGIVNAVIMLLIITGGIGFMTWEDIRTKGFHFRKYRMQSRVILMGTALLIMIPAAYFFFFEFSSAGWGEMSLSERIWRSLFQAVTPRTAGFNSVDLNGFGEAGQLLLMLLMLIGGAPGSTAGGMKVTTAAVLLLTALASFRKKEDADCFGRRIPQEAIRNASAILMLYLVLFLTGAFFISKWEGLPIFDCMFETASAIGTVGLSLGITPALSLASRMILIVLMFLGRVGGLTLIFAALAPKGVSMVRLPKEKIMVG